MTLLPASAGPVQRSPLAPVLRRWFAATAPALASALVWTFIEGGALLRARLRRVA